MIEQDQVRCVNCGAQWTPKPLPGSGQNAPQNSYVCPVCQFRMSVTIAPAPAAPLSSGELATRLDALISEARSSGLAMETITQVLRDELEFAAEMAHAGRQLCVQIIDLGPQEADVRHRPIRDRREVLRSRTVLCPPKSSAALYDDRR